MTPFRVFLSAVSSEFGQARSEVASDLRARGLEVVFQKDFRQEPAADTTVRKLYDHIQSCDAVVCIVGKRSGAVPPTPAAQPFADRLPGGIARASYTQWEFYFARHYGKRPTIFLAKPGYVPDRPEADGEDYPELQAEFVRYLKGQGLDRSYFSSTHELCRLVLRQDWMASHNIHPSHSPEGLSLPLGVLLEHQSNQVAGIRPCDKVMGIIMEKLKSDFDYGNLATYTSQRNAQKESRLLLMKTGIGREQVLSQLGQEQKFHTHSWYGLVPPEIHAKIASFRDVTVQCVNIFPAAVATIRHMISRGMRICLFYSHSTGKELATMLDFRTINYYDFIATGEPGTHLSPSKEILSYRQVLSLCDAIQYAYKKRDDVTQNISILYTPGTSAEEQRRVTAPLTNAMFRACTVDSDQLRSLDDGECPILWSPQTHDGSLERIQETAYRYRFSLFAHESWARRDRENELAVFLNLFVSSWNYLRRNPRVAENLIREDPIYQAYFALGAGLELQQVYNST